MPKSPFQPNPKKYPEGNQVAARALREIGTPMPVVSKLTGIPLNTCKAFASRQRWTKDATHRERASDLQRYRLPNGAVPCPPSLIGAARLLRLGGEKIALVEPDDFKRIATVMDGPEDHKSLILKEMGYADLESSGEEFEAKVDCLQREACATVSALVAKDSGSTSYDDPLKIARSHAEKAGRNALKVAADAPPPIKTWRDLEIAAKLAGVATEQGTKPQPLINIAMLNDPGRFAKPVGPNPVRQSEEDSLQDVDPEALEQVESLASQAMVS